MAKDNIDNEKGLGIKIACGLAAGAIAGSACWVALKNQKVTALISLISIVATYIIQK